MQGICSTKGFCFSALTIFWAISSFIVSELGGWDTSLKFLMTAIGIDYGLGIMIALIWHKSKKSSDGTFESHASLKGLFRKLSVLILVYIAVQLDILLQTNGYIRTMVILFFITNEGFSIIENLALMGVPMPVIIKDSFAVLKSSTNKKE